MKLIRTLTLAALAALALACAKEDTPSVDIEQISLDAWMQRHTSGFTRHDNGLYTKVLRAATSAADTLPEEEDWIEIRFTGYSLPDLPLSPTGEMFVTRDSLIARQYGTWTAKTHYAPKKVILATLQTYATLTEAMVQTIRMMRPGEIREFYAPSALAYGSAGTTSYTYGDWGYQGQNPLAGNVPSHMEIELVRIIGPQQAMLDDQNTQVQAFAQQHLGLAAADSLKDNFYLKYTPLDPLADTIGADSTTHIYYVGMFLDGHVFDTNIDSIAARAWGDRTHHDSLTYIPSGGSLIEAFRIAVDTMTYDSWGEMVFSSDYGYGTGNAPSVGTGAAEIDPYTPLHFRFYIAPKVVVEDDGDEAQAQQ